MGASKIMSKDKSMDAGNSRADNRRNTCNSMDASSIMDNGKSMDATNRRTNLETPGLEGFKKLCTDAFPVHRRKIPVARKI
jgi:hypothetical protein